MAAETFPLQAFNKCVFRLQRIFTSHSVLKIKKYESAYLEGKVQKDDRQVNTNSDVQ